MGIDEDEEVHGSVAPILVVVDGRLPGLRRDRRAGLADELARRLVDAKVRYISLPSDYFALYLLLGIGVTGLLMRHVEKVDVVHVKAAIAGWTSLQPVVPSGVGIMYFLHVFLVSALLVYLPFSKLLHAPGVFFSPTRNQVDNPREQRHLAPWAAELEK